MLLKFLGEQFNSWNRCHRVYTRIVESTASGVVLYVLRLNQGFRKLIIV